MNLIHLPTLDGSTEAAVARLDTLSRLQQTDEMRDALAEAYAEVEEIVSLVGPAGKQEGRNREGYAAKRVARIEACLREVEAELDLLDVSA